MRLIDRLRLLGTRWVRARSSPTGPPEDAGLRARGYVEHLETTGANLVLSGWLFQPGFTLDVVQVLLNGHGVSGTTFFRRDDVAVSYPTMPESAHSGFRCVTPIPPPRADGWIDVEIVGLAAGRPAARITTRYRTDFRDGLPEPPEALRVRVTNLADPMPYWTGALQTYSEFRGALDRHAASPPRRLLDWGCGCGRVTALFLRWSGIPEVHGIDIDAEAIAWCAASLPGGRFATVAPTPPTPLPDSAFDAVVAYSVLTHLRRSDQIAWLREMRRVLAPGGLLLASVHGEFAAVFTKRPDVHRELREGGFSDATPDRNLDGVAPDGYYRATYQTKAWTLREWSREMPIVDYVERGMSGYQDLVVLRRPR